MWRSYSFQICITGYRFKIKCIQVNEAGGAGGALFTKIGGVKIIKLGYFFKAREQPSHGALAIDHI